MPDGASLKEARDELLRLVFQTRLQLNKPGPFYEDGLRIPERILRLRHAARERALDEIQKLYAPHEPPAPEERAPLREPRRIIGMEVD